MIKYLISLLILLPIATDAAKLSNPMAYTPVYKQIRRIKPEIDPTYAAHLTASIYEVSRAFKIEPRLLTAILAQESKFEAGAYNAKTKDIGIAQINHKTARMYNFDVTRLETDTNYSIWAAGIVLNDFHKTYKGRYYWTHYNSSKPDKMEEYKQLVARFM